MGCEKRTTRTSDRRSAVGMRSRCGVAECMLRALTSTWFPVYCTIRQFSWKTSMNANKWSRTTVSLKEDSNMILILLPLFVWILAVLLSQS
jgi:hypothetical protein